MERTYLGVPRLSVGERWRPWGTVDVRYQNEAAGLPYRLVRNEEGVSWAYVGVPARHPYYGLQLDDCPMECTSEGVGCEHSPRSELQVPGGLQLCGLDGELWWFGFHCAGHRDRASRQAAHLARQLAARLPPLPPLLPPADSEANGDMFGTEE